MDSKYKPGSVTSLVGWVIGRTSSGLKNCSSYPPKVPCWWAQPKLEWHEKRRRSRLTEIYHLHYHSHYHYTDVLTATAKVFMTDLLVTPNWPCFGLRIGNGSPIFQKKYRNMNHTIPDNTTYTSLRFGTETHRQQVTFQSSSTSDPPEAVYIYYVMRTGCLNCNKISDFMF